MSTLDLPRGLVWSGTGHRPDKIGAQEAAVRREIQRRLLLHQPAAIISGMAQGFDTWFAEEALTIGLRVVAAVPFFGQESRWPRDVQRKYHDLLARIGVHGVVEVLHTQRPKTDAQASEWLNERNVWMVDRAQAVLACYNGDVSGGTANCVRYAKMRKKPLDIIDPYNIAETIS